MSGDLGVSSQILHAAAVTQLGQAVGIWPIAAEQAWFFLFSFLNREVTLPHSSSTGRYHWRPWAVEETYRPQVNLWVPKFQAESDFLGLG